MDDPSRVHEGQDLEKLAHDVARMAFAEAAARHDAIKELAAGGLVHHQKELCGRLEHLVERDHARVPQRRKRADLIAQPSGDRIAGAGEACLEQQLCRKLAPVGTCARRAHHRERPAADFVRELVRMLKGFRRLMIARTWGLG